MRLTGVAWLKCSLRGAGVQASYATQICVPYANMLEYGHVVQAEVMRVSPGGVFLNGREEPVDFDYLVIATGTSYAFPAKIAISHYADTPPLYATMQTTIENATRVVVVGGGPTGVELCGEILERYPDKTVTLVHSRERLIGEPYREAFSEAVQTKLESIGVRIILNDRVDMKASSLAVSGVLETNFISGEQILRTTQGQELECDLVFFCTGARVNKASYESDFAAVCDERGRLRVRETLQVEGYSNIFAMGDCTNVDEPKLGYAAQQQAAVLAKNIMAMHTGKPLKAYAPGSPVMIVTIGAKGGVSQLPVAGKIMGDMFSRMVKSKGLFTAHNWSVMRLKMPAEGSLVPADKLTEPGEDDAPRLAQAMQMTEDEATVLLAGLPPAERDGADYT